jgi:hypothetical protein
MPRIHTLGMQVSKTTCLCVAYWGIKYATYSELEVIKACGEGGDFLSRRPFIAEATYLVRDVIKNKNKNKADHYSS